jgi:hypothetical protein
MSPGEFKGNISISHANAREIAASHRKTGDELGLISLLRQGGRSRPKAV